MLECRLQESVANPNTFSMIERFADQAALDAHLTPNPSRPPSPRCPLVSGMPKVTKYIADDGIELPLR